MVIPNSDQGRRKVFISYNHRDIKWLKRLQTHLKGLEKSGLVEFWDDTKIQPGDNWREEIRAALGSARIAVLLISANFLASDFIEKDELPPLLVAAETDGVIILSLILSPCLFEESENISRFQSINPPSQPLIKLRKAEQEEYLVKLSKAVFNIVKKSVGEKNDIDRIDAKPILEGFPPSDGHISKRDVKLNNGAPEQTLPLLASASLETISAAATNLARNHINRERFERRSPKLALLRKCKQIIVRHLWLILAIITLMVPIASIQAYRARPIYQAMTIIEIQPETISLSKLGEALVVDSTDNTKAESVIIRSAPVVKRAVVSLNLDSNPRFMAVNTNRTVLEAFNALRGKKTELKAAEAAASSSIVIGANESGRSPTGENQSSPSAQPDRKRLDPYIQTLTNNLRVERVRDTRLIFITFTHIDPEIAAEVANGVAKSFIEESFERKTKRFASTLNWLESSTDKLKAQVQQAEQRLANFNPKNNSFSLGGKDNLMAEKIAQLHDQYMRAETDLLLKKSLYEEVKHGRVDQWLEAFADAKTAEMQKNLNALAQAASELSAKYGARYSKLQEIQQQMGTIKIQIDANRSTLEERLKADCERALRDDQDLVEALNRAKSEVVQENQTAIQYRILQQNLATAKALYTDFLNKTSPARAEQYNNVRMIEEAAPPPGPIGPYRTRTIMFGILWSIALGVGLAFMIEYLNTAVRTPDELSRTTQLPVLAVIPTFTHLLSVSKRTSVLGSREASAGQAVVTLEGVPLDQADGQETAYDCGSIPNPPILDKTLREFSAAAEAYRILRTSLLLSTAQQSPKRILVTSGQPGEGKTTTVMNMAIALSQLKAEVVVVDCDMRKPRVHKLAHLPKGDGLSTYLTRGGELYKYIHRARVPHLSILPCGFIPPNPSELISSEKMRDLMQLLARGYDYVILDSPPLTRVTDPIILSTLVDGVILVARSNVTRIEFLQQAIQDLSSVGAKMLGVILNDFNPRHEGFDYYDQYDHDDSEQSDEKFR